VGHHNPGSNLIPKSAKNENGSVVKGHEVGGITAIPPPMLKLEFVENESKW
jgi:hypothetical protein